MCLQGIDDALGSQQASREDAHIIFPAGVESADLVSVHHSTNGFFFTPLSTAFFPRYPRSFFGLYVIRFRGLIKTLANGKLLHEPEEVFGRINLGFTILGGYISMASR